MANPSYIASIFAGEPSQWSVQDCAANVWL